MPTTDTISRQQHNAALQRAIDGGYTVTAPLWIDASETRWYVFRPDDSGYHYTVHRYRYAAAPTQYTCNCPAGSFGAYCKHTALVIFVEQATATVV